jgi:hypothetical protein
MNPRRSGREAEPRGEFWDERLHSMHLCTVGRHALRKSVGIGQQERAGTNEAMRRPQFVPDTFTNLEAAKRKLLLMRRERAEEIEHCLFLCGIDHEPTSVFAERCLGKNGTVLCVSAGLLPEVGPLKEGQGDFRKAETFELIAESGSEMLEKNCSERGKGDEPLSYGPNISPRLEDREPVRRPRRESGCGE